MSKAQSSPTEVFGWAITHGVHHNGCPFVEMSKPGFPVMGERGEPGIDPDIMLQRLLPRALAKEMENATPVHRGEWQARLLEAEQERDDARMLRRERALREQNRALQKAQG
jgi:hypothetical protein